MAAVPTININTVFDQAYKFAYAHSWYKLYEPETCFVTFVPVQGFHDSNNSRKYYKMILCREDTEWENVDAEMKQVSLKYAVTITNALSGDGYSSDIHARNLYNDYMSFLKEHGRIEQDAEDLPEWSKSLVEDLVFDFTHTRDLHKQHEHDNWRIIGQIAHAAERTALALGFDIVTGEPSELFASVAAVTPCEVCTTHND